MDKKIQKIKLEDEKKILEDELNSIGHTDDNGNWKAIPENETNGQEVQDEGDMAERAEDYEERSIKLNALVSRLNDINKSLEKLNTDNYGICESCGKEIEEDRIEVNPAALTCKECMNKI